MGWNSATVAVAFNAQDKISELMDNRDSIRGDETANSTSSEYSLVGFNTAKIDEVKQVITTEINNLTNVIDGINELAKAEGAFKSDSDQLELAIQAYIKNVKNYIILLINRLNAFNTRLGGVQQAWKQSVQKMASAIEDYTSETKVESQPNLNSKIESRTTGSISNGSSLY